MCDSGRLEEYQEDMRVWRIEHGGASSWVVAESAGAALREVESIEDSDSDDFHVRVVPPKESITVVGEDPKDFPDRFLEADDEFFDGGRVRFIANAAEWAEYVVTELKPKSSAFHLCGTEI